MSTILNPYRYAAGGGGVPDFGGASRTFVSAQSDYISVPNDSSLDIGTNGFSISVWTTASGSVTGSLVNKRTASGTFTGYQLLINGLNDVQFDIGDTTGLGRLETTSNPVASNSTWKHIVGTAPSGTDRRDRTNWKIYVNNSLVTGVTEVGSDLSNDNIDTTDALNFGRIEVTTPIYYLNGNLADVRIYTKELSSGEVSDLYNFTHVSDSLHGWWLLDADNFEDNAQSNDGTDNGTTFSTDGPAD